METKPYRPSNGDEGMCFMSQWCDKCTKDRPGKPCSILGRTMGFSLGDADYPKEWIRDDTESLADWHPRCTAFTPHKPHSKPSRVRDKRQIGLGI